MKTIGIVGSRRRNVSSDYAIVTTEWAKIYERGDRIVSGGCPTGADAYAERIAELEGVTIIIHWPDWKKHGRYAGLKRNDKIAADADILIALVAEDRTGGTEDTIRKYKALGKTEVILC